MKFKILNYKMRLLDYRLYWLLPLMLLFLNNNSARSQLRQVTEVTVNLSKQDAAYTAPFDETFEFVFTNEVEVEAIEISYKIKGFVKNNAACTDARYTGDQELNENDHYHQSGHPDVDDCGRIIKFVKRVNEKKFNVSGIGPLHANTAYVFTFRIFSKAELDSNKADRLKKDLRKHLKQYYLNSAPNLTQFKKDFADVIDNSVGRDIYGGNGEPVGVSEIIVEDLHEVIVHMNNNNTSLDDSKTDYTNDIPNTLGIIAAVKANSADNIKGIDKKSIKNPELLDQPINPTIKGYEKTTLKDMVTFLTNDFARNNQYLKLIIEGKARIKGNLIEPLEGQDTYDVANLELIASTFIMIKNLQKTNGKPYNVDTNIDDLIKDLTNPNNSKNMISLAKSIRKHRNAISDDQIKIPDILDDRFFAREVDISYETNADVESKAIPYIGLDIGLGYATELEDMFAFQIVNFHLRPVNRRAYFSDLKGIDEILKRTSIQVGLAQRLGGGGDNYVTLLGDLGTPYAGIGFRISRIFRLSGGALFYEERDSNPVISDKTFKVSPMVTLSIDLQLSEALGAIGGLFSVN